MSRMLAVLVLPLLLQACALNPFAREPEPAAPPASIDVSAPGPEVAPPSAPPAAVASAPEALDTVPEAEKAAAREAAAAAPAGGTLGQVTVSLGDPGDPGLWVKSALVDSDQTGTVRTGDGDAIAVTLRPLASAESGAQISLSAMQALGLPLVGLHTVTLTAQ